MMVTAIPVSAKLTIVNGKKRYANNYIKFTAGDDDLLIFAQALNSLQYSAADKFIKSLRHELVNE